MQEHIRRAHPDHYIPKLPATEESIQSMINTPPSARPRPLPTSDPSNTLYSSNNVNSTGSQRSLGGVDGTSFGQDQRLSSYSSPIPPRSFEDQYPAAATAAVALAQLHGSGKDSEWASEVVSEYLGENIRWRWLKQWTGNNV